MPKSHLAISLGPIYTIVIGVKNKIKQNMPTDKNQKPKPEGANC